MTLLVWEIEWRVALARRRLFLLNVIVPMALVLPVALGAAPAVHAAAVYAVLFTIFGTFGSAIPLVRDAESGLTARILRAGVSPAGCLLQRAAAGALLDALQLVPALAMASLGAGAETRAFLVALGAVAGTMWVTSLWGVWVAAVARSLAEAALLSAVSTLFLLHASGVFRTPATGSFAAAVEAAAPFRLLHESLLSMSLGQPAGGSATLAAWCAILLLGTALSAPRLGRSLAQSASA